MNNPIFVHIKNPRDGKYYPSYNDYFRIVGLSGFGECDIEQVNPFSNNTYIITLNYHGIEQKPLPDSFFPVGRTARFIHHQIERFDIIDERFDEIWVYDKSIPELSHPKCQYVFMGGHKDFSVNIGNVTKRYDFIDMCYREGRRGAMIAELAKKHSITPDFWDFNLKNRILQQARVGLCLHQDERKLIEPTRYTVFSLYKLPLLVEKCNNASPYFTYSYEKFLQDGNFWGITNHNYELVTQNTFKDCILKALN